MVFVNKVLLDRPMPIHLSIARVSGTKLNGCCGDCVITNIFTMSTKSVPTPSKSGQRAKFRDT